MPDLHFHFHQIPGWVWGLLVLGLFIFGGLYVASKSRNTPAHSNEAELIQEWVGQNLACRGGSGDESSTWEACGARDVTARRLNELGYCYGKKGQSGAQMQWHRCGPDSIKSQEE
jgi:hypothetical protein